MHVEDEEDVVSRNEKPRVGDVVDKGRDKLRNEEKSKLYLLVG